MRVEDWGLIEYGPSVERQLALVEEVASGLEERLVICSHPPVVTLGRAATAADMMGWQGPVYEASRGGRVTYHGPNQVVIYPILDLRRPHAAFVQRDIHAYLRMVESAVVRGLSRLGAPGAQARTTKQGEVSLTGVWVGESKIASIGIAVRRWVTYHGVAINICEDPRAFQGIRPCGFSSDVMISLERVLGRSVQMDLCKDTFGEVFADVLFREHDP